MIHANLRDPANSLMALNCMARNRQFTTLMLTVEDRLFADGVAFPASAPARQTASAGASINSGIDRSVSLIQPRWCGPVEFC